MKAIILAGGEGSRLQPITQSIPKIMVPINKKPLLEYIREWLDQYEIIDTVIIRAHYLIEKIIEHLSITHDKHFATMLGDELKPSGTAGAVLLSKDDLDDTFFVIYGDLLTNLNLNQMYQFHRKNKALLTIAVTKSDRQDVGKVIIDKANRVIGFYEKDPNIKSELINMGIYVVEPEIFDFIPKGKSDFALNVIPDLLKRGIMVSAFEFDGYYNDIGTMERYIQANEDVKVGNWVLTTLKMCGNI